MAHHNPSLIKGREMPYSVREIKLRFMWTRWCLYIIALHIFSKSHPQIVPLYTSNKKH